MCRLIQQIALPMLAYGVGYFVSAKYPSGGYTFFHLLCNGVKYLLFPFTLVVFAILWPS